VPFDEMYQEIQRGVTEAVTNPPLHQYQEIQRYINNMLAQLAHDYAEIAGYAPTDRAMLASINGRTRALCELALHFNIDVTLPEHPRG
jgi:hypothetical protein